jgi:hypothetical protein
MPRLSGYVFDHHDDVDGRIVRSAFPSYSDIPDFVKTASRLSEAAVEDLPDDQFALVLLDNGFKLKKYATVDAGNTALSILYLLKQAHLLPPGAVKLAAINLIGACQYHNLDVPQELIKAAQTGAGMGVSGKGEIPYGPGAKVQKKTFSDPPRESRENPQLGNADAAWSDVKERVNRTGTPGVNDVQIPPFSPKETQKTASASYETVLKQRVWREAPYFDASDWNPSEHEVTEEPTMPQRTLLDEKYPVDSFSQVKTASIYFNEKWREFHPRQRHEYCVKLASRMLELGLEVPTEMERYASTTYAADVDGYVGIRRSYVPEEFHSSLDLLIEKRAHVKPETFAETLAEFDRMTGLRLEWDAGIPDPWMSTFGPSFEKLADENWRWDKDGTRISKDDLENLARNGHELVAKTLGADFAKEFSKRPKEVFMSLPDPNKLILARMASDRNAGTGTE